MSDKSPELMRKMEQATARAGAPQSELDAETAQLRDAWTALGRLLETAAPLQGPPFGRWSRRPPSRRRYWLLTVAVALAASLLVGAVATWMWRAAGSSGRSGTTPQTAQSDVKVALPQKVVKTPVRRPIQAPSQQQAAPSESEPKWDDSLDEQLAQVGRQVISVQQDWTSHAVARAVIQYELEQVQEDLGGNNL